MLGSTMSMKIADMMLIPQETANLSKVMDSAKKVPKNRFQPLNLFYGMDKKV